MLISFDKSDFCSKERWLSLLGKLNIPEPVQSNVEMVSVETSRVNVTEKYGEQINTIRFNPDTEVRFC